MKSNKSRRTEHIQKVAQHREEKKSLMSQIKCIRHEIIKKTAVVPNGCIDTWTEANDDYDTAMVAMKETNQLYVKCEDPLCVCANCTAIREAERTLSRAACVCRLVTNFVVGGGHRFKAAPSRTNEIAPLSDDETDSD